MPTILTAIRQLYKPVQPTVSPSAVGVSYHEFPPAPLLQDYLYYYWKLSTVQPLTEPLVYRVVADANSITIRIDIRNEPWGDRHFAIEDPNGVGLDLVRYAAPKNRKANRRLSKLWQSCGSPRLD